MDWIRTSKQLPPKGQWVLTTDNYNFQHPWKIQCYRGIEKRESWIHYPGTEKSKKYIISEHIWYDTFGRISHEHPEAWMPLPEPYEEENEQWENG